MARVKAFNVQSAHNPNGHEENKRTGEEGFITSHLVGATTVIGHHHGLVVMGIG